MPISSSPPSYRKHKATGQAVVTLNGKDFYLGPHGSAASRAKYDRLIAEWLASGRRLTTSEAVTVADVIARFWSWAENHYRKTDGTPTSEVGECRYSLRPLNHLYGKTPAGEFGPLKLKSVRQLMIDGYDHPKYGRQKPLSRGVINRRVERIKRMFRWATENELVPSSVFHGLLAIRGLERGRTEARETKPVRPVPESLIDAVRPHVSRPLEALIDLQLLTGARPGELCIMRRCDIDTGGKIWVYRPDSHKTQHRGQTREIYLGPRAQAILEPFFTKDAQAYLFSPQKAEADRLKKMREERKTKVQPSQASRKKKHPKKRPGDRYDVSSYRRAVSRACAIAFPLPKNLAPVVKADGRPETTEEWRARLTSDEIKAVRAWRRRHHWHPHQLRHNAATNLRKEYGVELARIILGHSTAFTTEIYAETDRHKAMDVMREIG